MMDTEALLASAPPGTFVVVKRKFLQLFLAAPSDGSQGIAEAAQLDTSNGNEDVVVLADDLEKAMSRLPGHEAARVSLFKQMMDATTHFSRLVDAAIDSDGFYVAQHVASRLQKNALDEEERYVRAAYQRTVEWNGEYGYGYSDPYGYGTFRSFHSYTSMQPRDEHHGSVAAGQAFLIEQSMVQHRREKAAAIIQAAWRAFKARTSPIVYQPRHKASAQAQEWARKQRGALGQARNSREAEWNPYVQPTTDKPYERSIHAPVLDLPPMGTQAGGDRGGGGKGAPRWNASNKLEGLPEQVQLPQLTQRRRTSEMGQLGLDKESSGLGHGPAAPDLPVPKTRRPRTVRWAAAEELSWIQEGGGGTNGKTPYTAFASLHERVRQMSGPMYQTFAIPESLLNPEEALMAALQEAKAAKAAALAFAAAVAEEDDEPYIGGGTGRAPTEWSRQTSMASERASRHGTAQRLSVATAGSPNRPLSPRNWQATAPASTVPLATVNVSVLHRGRGPCAMCAQQRFDIARAVAGARQTGDGQLEGRRSRRTSISEYGGGAEPSGRRSRRASVIVSEVFVPMAEDAGIVRGRRASLVLPDPPIAPEAGRRSRRNSYVKWPNPSGGEARDSAPLAPGEALASLGLPSPFPSTTNVSEPTDGAGPTASPVDEPWCLCDYHYDLQNQIHHKGVSQEALMERLMILGHARAKPVPGAASGAGGEAGAGRGGAEGRRIVEEEERHDPRSSESGSTASLQVRGLGRWLSAEDKVQMGYDVERLKPQPPSTDSPSKHHPGLRRLTEGSRPSPLVSGSGTPDVDSVEAPTSPEQESEAKPKVLVLPFLKSPGPPAGGKAIQMSHRGSKSCGMLPQLPASRASAPGSQATGGAIGGLSNAMAKASVSLLRSLHKSSSGGNDNGGAPPIMGMSSPQTSRLRKGARASVTSETDDMGSPTGQQTAGAAPWGKAGEPPRRTSVAGILSHFDLPVSPARLPRFSIGGGPSIASVPEAADSAFF